MDQARLRTRSTVSESQAYGAEADARNFGEQRIRQMQDYAVLRSPIQGVVTRRLLDPGVLLQPNQAVLVVADVRTLRCVIQVPERESTFVTVATPVTVKLDALPDAPIEARVSRTSEALDPNSRTLTCQVHLPNGGGKLKPGMFGRIDVGLEKHAGVLRVPSKAIVREKKNAFLFVSGVDGQKMVVVAPPDTLADGSAVVAQPLPHPVRN